MGRHRAWIVVATMLTTVLFASVTTSGDIGLWIAPQSSPSSNESPPAPVERAIDVMDEPAPTEPATTSSFVLAGWAEAILEVIVSGAVLVGLVALVLAGWRRRPRLRWRRRRVHDADFEPLPDVAAAVVDDADAQRSALLVGAPRNAIVRCWLRLEHDVAAAGLSRHPADTSAEFTERVLAHYSIDQDAIRELASAYRLARFSDHPIDESARSAALDALDRLHRGLTAHAGRRTAIGAAAAGGAR